MKTKEHSTHIRHNVVRKNRSGLGYETIFQNPQQLRAALNSLLGKRMLPQKCCQQTVAHQNRQLEQGGHQPARQYLDHSSVGMGVFIYKITISCTKLQFIEEWQEKILRNINYFEKKKKRRNFLNKFLEGAMVRRNRNPPFCPLRTIKPCWAHIPRVQHGGSSIIMWGCMTGCMTTTLNTLVKQHHCLKDSFMFWHGQVEAQTSIQQRISDLKITVPHHSPLMTPSAV